MEVVYDLDTEAREKADAVGVQLVRVPTVGTAARFVGDLVDALVERAAEARGEAVSADFPGSPALGVRSRLLPQPPSGPAGPLRQRLSAVATVDADHPLPDGTDLVELERLCIELPSRPARFIRDERPARLGVAETKSTDTDVVTVMDRASEELLHRLILEARPDDGILGEEGADVAGSSGLTWVIDPIDGTVNYLYDIPAYAVSVAVVVGDPSGQGTWTPVAGAVADPSLRLVHHARRGGGAWTRREDGSDATPLRRLSVSSESRLARSLLATGFGYAPRRGPARWPCSSGCCRSCATSGASAAPPSTSCGSRRAPSTPTPRRASTRGTSRPAGSSSRRPAAASSASTDRGAAGLGPDGRARGPRCSSACTSSSRPSRPVPEPADRAGGATVGAGSGGAEGLELGHGDAVLGGEPGEGLELAGCTCTR